MANDKPRFVMLKSINGDPLLVNLSAIRTVSTINLAGDDVGVVSFDKSHEVVIGSTVEEVVVAMGQPPVPIAD